MHSYFRNTILARCWPTPFFSPVCAVLIGALAVSAPAWAQKGDRTGEQQTDRIPLEKIPPAPVLAPAEALKTLKVARGFSVELVASEPLVRDPVAMVFDP